MKKKIMLGSVIVFVLLAAVFFIHSSLKDKEEVVLDNLYSVEFQYGSYHGGYYFLLLRVSMV